MNTRIEVLFDSSSWNTKSAETMAQQLADMVSGEIDSTYDSGDEVEVEILTEDSLVEVEEALADYVEELSGVSINIAKH